MSSRGSPPLQWKFSQVFGERKPGEEIQNVDVISALEFEKGGDYLATGDHGGRIVLFECIDGKDVCTNKTRSRKEMEKSDNPAVVCPEYRYKTEFQSHEPEFDYLKSVEIEEKINKVRWCATPNNSQFILSANDRTIKLWKVLEQKVKKIKEMDPNPSVSSENTLLAEQSYVMGQNEPSISSSHRLEWTNKMPTIACPSPQEDFQVINKFVESASARCRRVYAHAHDFNINSLSTNSDGETYISADDLRINLWNLEVSDQCFNIVDMKPSNMEDLTEVITSAEFHPVYCNLLAYGSSRGFIRLVDMRKSALCDQHARMLHDGDAHGSKSFFTEIIASISDIKFVTDGRYLLSRDYMNLKLWDLHMDASPVETFKIHEYIRPKLCDLYNNDSIFDKFKCSASEDGLHFASGAYSNLFRVFSRGAGSENGTTLEASRNPNRKQSTSPIVQKPAKTRQNFSRAHYRRVHGTSSSEIGDFPCNLDSKVLHLAWHPTRRLIACTVANSLYMYYS